MFQKVEDNKDLIRDVSTKAVINTNIDQYLKYVAQKKAKLLQQQEFEDLKAKVNDLDAKIDKILDLITGKWDEKY